MNTCYSDHNEDVRTKGTCDYCNGDAMLCPTCGQEMQEYSDDRYGIDYGLSPTVYAGSVMACPEHGTIAQQWEAADIYLNECEHEHVKFVPSEAAYWPGSLPVFECLDCGATTTEWEEWEEMQDGFVERGREPIW